MEDEEIIIAAERVSSGDMTPDDFIALGLSEGTLLWMRKHSLYRIADAVGAADLPEAQGWLALYKRINAEVN